MKSIRVMIVDDHHMVRASLAMSLDGYDDIEVVGQASDGLEAISLYTDAMPDVVLMDLIMPEMSGVEAIKRITEAHPLSRIIALSSFSDKDLVHDALEAGAMGYMLKNASLAELIRAIKDAMEGKSTLAQEATEALVASTRQPRLSIDLFTEREQEVLKLLIAGRTNQQISENLNLSVSAVKFHVSNILSKLHAETRTEAVSIALQHKLIIEH